MVTPERVLSPQLLFKDKWVPKPLQRDWNPKSDLGKLIRGCLKYLPADMGADLIEQVTKTLVIESRLSLIAVVWDDRKGFFRCDNYGIVGDKVVTTAGVNFLVQAWIASAT